MKYVYIIQSQKDPARHYTGLTDDPVKRLRAHNASQSKHTSKFAPWTLRTVIGFDDESRAVEFERYLKSGSCRAFAKRRF